jgi:hypothetical protein
MSGYYSPRTTIEHLEKGWRRCRRDRGKRQQALTIPLAIYALHAGPAYISWSALGSTEIAIEPCATAISNVPIDGVWGQLLLWQGPCLAGAAYTYTSKANKEKR